MFSLLFFWFCCFFFQAEDGIRDAQESRGLGDVYKRQQSASFEPRFSALLKAHRDDLPILLKQILSILRGEDIPINWDQLFLDLQYWNTENHIVQRRWANSYWIYAGSPEQTPSEITQ